MLQKENYDVILMDVRMPVMGGIEATREIRKNKEESKSGIPIIALTGATNKEDVEECKVSGMNDIIAKPFKEQELYEKLLLALNIPVK